MLYTKNTVFEFSRCDTLHAFVVNSVHRTTNCVRGMKCTYSLQYVKQRELPLCIVMLHTICNAVHTVLHTLLQGVKCIPHFMSRHA